MLKPTGACGRADLVRVLSQGNPETIELAAELLGFKAIGALELKGSAIAEAYIKAQLTVGATDPVELPDDAQPLGDIPFWRVEAFEALAAAEAEEQPLDAAEADVVWTNRPKDPLRIPLLAPWRELQARLRQEAAQRQETRSPDVGAALADHRRPQ